MENNCYVCNYWIMITAKKGEINTAVCAGCGSVYEKTADGWKIVEKGRQVASPEDGELGGWPS